MSRIHRRRMEQFLLDGPAAAAQHERDSMMTAWSIRRDGQRFECNGCHFDRLSDALLHARRALQQRSVATAPPARGRPQ